MARVASPHPSATDLAAQLAALYILAEQQLLAGGTSALRRAASGSIDAQLVAISTIRKLAHQIAFHLGTRTDPLIQAMVTAAVTSGRETASEQVSNLLANIGAGGAGGGGRIPPSTALDIPDEEFNLSMGHGERAAQAIARDLTSSFEDVRRRITRLPDDIYKAIAPHGAIYQVHDNPFTPAQAQAAAWRVFTSQGVRGFTDKSGRDWSLSAYTEMAVRTASMRAYNDSHMQVMQAVGIDLFTVSDDGHPCPLCFPWQDRILSNEPDDRAEATIEQATAAGLFHPNCRHVLLPYIPEFTKLPTPGVWTDEMAKQYRLTQSQRRLELEIRKAKRTAEYALTPEARADAKADIQRLQARMRQFINDTGLLRRSRREQLDLTDQRIKLPTPIR